MAKKPIRQDMLDDETISFQALGRQLISVVTISVLGLALVACTLMLASPYSLASMVDKITRSDTVDVSVGIPAERHDAKNIVRAPDQPPPAVDAQNNPLSDELSQALAAEAAKERNQSLDETNEQVESEVTDDMADQRNAEIEENRKSAQMEEQRILVEEAAAKAAGSLVNNGSSTVVMDPTIAQALATMPQGFVAPAHAGTYRRSAGWGQTGLWARYHTGVDLSAPTGTPLYAVASGVVMTSDTAGWSGINVIIMFADGSQALYAHMSKKIVQPGQIVEAGELVGYVGQTGRAFGAHCHFEYYPPGTKAGDVYSSKDPVAWLSRNGVNI